jgi:hypothetical protein
MDRNRSKQSALTFGARIHPATLRSGFRPIGTWIAIALAKTFGIAMTYESFSRLEDRQPNWLPTAMPATSARQFSARARTRAIHLPENT